MSTDIWRDWPLILAYHSISDIRDDSLAVTVADFEYQMAWLKQRGYKSMTLAQFGSQAIREKGARIVVITFDDGYADNHRLALPILKRYGFVATMFLVSDWVNTDRVFPWDISKMTAQRNRKYFEIVTWEQAREMATYGIEIGSHTCNHYSLTELSPEECWEEISRSRVQLQQRLGQEVASFCYPRGYLNMKTVEMVRKAGYSHAVVTPRRSGIPLNRYTLRRIGIYHHNTPLIFRLKTSSFVRRNYERLKLLPWKR